MDGCVNVILDHFLRDQNCVFEVITLPRHKRHENISSESQFAIIGAGAIRQWLTDLDLISLSNDRFLIETSTCIRTKKFSKFIAVDAALMITARFLYETRG